MFLKLLSGKQIQGWASIMVVVLIIGGVQMIMLGVIGEYLWRNLEESRKKPLFLIEDQSDNN
jgi:dolichol-phosphate mannosyltransferase